MNIDQETIILIVILVRACTRDNLFSKRSLVLILMSTTIITQKYKPK